jgi:hypothetical protein
MKKTTRLLSALLIVCMLAFSLSSCGKILMGKYFADVDLIVLSGKVTYEFGIFGTVTRTTVSEAILGDPEIVVTEGKYEISENPEKPEQLIIVFEFEGEERQTSSFAQGEENGVKYIKIDGIQYNIVKD